MSKLEDLFRRAATRAPQPLGFGTAARDESGSGILLIGYARSQDISKSPELSKADVDAIVLDSRGKAVSKTAANALENTVWGSENAQFDAEGIEELKGQGCDFLIFDATDTSSMAVTDDDLSSFLHVSGELDRMTAAAVNVLGFTGLSLVDALAGSSLDVQQLIDLAKLQAQVEGPLLVRGSRVYASSEITALRNAGVNALLVALDDAETIREIRGNMRQVQPKRSSSSRSSSWSALAPHSPDEEDE